MNRLIAIGLVVLLSGLHWNVATAKGPETGKNDEKKTEKSGTLVVKNKIGDKFDDGSFGLRAIREGGKPVMLNLKADQPVKLVAGQYKTVSFSARSTKGDASISVSMIYHEGFVIEENETLTIDLFPPTGFDIQVTSTKKTDSISLYVSNTLKSETGMIINDIMHRTGKSRRGSFPPPNVQVYTADGKTLLTQGPMTHG